jgi:hypothetical protein
MLQGCYKGVQGCYKDVPRVLLPSLSPVGPRFGFAQRRNSSLDLAYHYGTRSPSGVRNPIKVNVTLCYVSTRDTGEQCVCV